MKITATHKTTGETVDGEINNISDLINMWRLASEYEKLATNLKDQMKKILPNYLNEDGKSEEVDGYRFTSTNVQRRNYDKSVMREVFDEDTLDLLLKPDKTLIDKYLKEHLEDIGEGSTLLRNTMIDEGRPYNVSKLERLS